MSERSPERDHLAGVLANHWPRLFVCSCGTPIKCRPLPDRGEREAAWAEHVAAELAKVLRATTEVIWGISHCGDEQVDEWWEEREHAEEQVDGLRKGIAAGRWSAADYEPLRLMQSTRTEFRAIEGSWTPVDISTPPGSAGEPS